MGINVESGGEGGAGGGGGAGNVGDGLHRTYEEAEPWSYPGNVGIRGVPLSTDRAADHRPDTPGIAVTYNPAEEVSSYLGFWGAESPPAPVITINETGLYNVFYEVDALRQADAAGEVMQVGLTLFYSPVGTSSTAPFTLPRYPSASDADRSARYPEVQDIALDTSSYPFIKNYWTGTLFAGSKLSLTVNSFLPLESDFSELFIYRMA